MSKKYKIRLLNLVEIDHETKLVTAHVSWVEKGFWRDKLAELESTFTYVGQGVWLGRDNLVVTDTELRLGLQEILVANVANKRLDEYVATL